MTSVLPLGLPLVRVRTRSVTLSEPRIAFISTICKTGPSSGIVMVRNWRVLLAPSMDAASYISGGIACRPVMKNSMLMPKFCQIDAIISMIMADVPPENHLTPSPPSSRIAELTTPWLWLNR